MLFLLLSCLAIIRCQFIDAQCVNRQPTYNVMNEAMFETSRNMVPQPLTPTFVAQNTLVETPCNVCNSLQQIPATNVIPGPITIVTDYSPSICKNLADTLQIMTVCNLLQSSKGSADVVLPLVSPILKEVLASPSFSCGCKNPIYSNPNILPTGVTSPVFNSGVIPSNFISTLPPNLAEGSYNKDLLPNIVSLLRNSF